MNSQMDPMGRAIAEYHRTGKDYWLGQKVHFGQKCAKLCTADVFLNA